MTPKMGNERIWMADILKGKEVVALEGAHGRDRVLSWKVGFAQRRGRDAVFVTVRKGWRELT
jgi:hypothetical protein